LDQKENFQTMLKPILRRQPPNFMQEFELIPFATADELARTAASAWLFSWEGRRVAVPIFLSKTNIREFGSATRRPSQN
jgi:hypothetical protein